MATRRILKVARLLPLTAAVVLAGCSAAAPSAPFNGPSRSPMAAPSAPPYSPASSAGAVQTRADLDRFVDALIAWGVAVEPILLVIEDESIPLEDFSARTEAYRAQMRAELAVLKATVPATIAPPFDDILAELVGAFEESTNGIDDVAVATRASDGAATQVALARWRIAVERKEPALTRLLEAARPMMTPADLAEWERALQGS